MLWRLHTMAESATHLPTKSEGGIQLSIGEAFVASGISLSWDVDVLDLDLTWTLIESEVDSLAQVATTELGST